MRSFLFVFGLLASTLLFAACGPGASSTAPTQPAAQKPIDVQVTLEEFKIVPSLTTFQVGVPYRFIVSNKGTVNHDFSITPPVMAGMAGMSEADMHKNALAVIDAKDLPPGASKTIDLTFSKPMSSSEIEIACHTPGHYESGMKLPISITQ